MSNTSLGPATKGSKFVIQRLAMPENKAIVDKKLGTILEWISPLEKDNFREYLINSPMIIDKLGLTEEKKDYLDSFWPTQQPRWDGIAMNDNKVLYLFEAKSHLDEIDPGDECNSENNNKIKYGSIMSVAKDLFGVEDTNANREIWCLKYYQIANRITFQQQLKKIVCENKNTVKYTDVKMIFLNFVNDETWKADHKMVTSSDAWDNHYDKILTEMGINREQLKENDIEIVNLDLKESGIFNSQEKQ